MSSSIIMRRAIAVILWILTAIGPWSLWLCDAFSAVEQYGFARSSRCCRRLGHCQQGHPIPPRRRCPGYGRFGSEYRRQRRLTSIAIDKEENVSENKDAYHETLVTDSLSSSSSSSSRQIFANFDYQAHWYPVIWARDLRLQEPTKVTVFDVDYVVARTSETEVICLHNVCPHKAAALSQGRVTDSGNIQCAYHGWSFDGQTGACVEIPQLVVVGNNMNDTMEQQGGGILPRMPLQSQATAVPAQIHQEMVWIFPGGNLEQALQAPPPPSIPEYTVGYQINGHFMRDFPHVDWSIVLSNVCDPDHGLFAHQAKGFDKYSASREHPMRITHESFPYNGKGWIVESKVDGVDKILRIDQEWRRRRTITSSNKKEGKEKAKEDGADQLAFMYFHAPSFVQSKRIEKSSIQSNNDKTATAASTVSSFSAVFWICPVGVGRSRFMSAVVVKKPVPLLNRRWITKLFYDNFLDQDTYLLATQQQYILGQEARDLRQALLTSANEEKSLTFKEENFSVGSTSKSSSSNNGQTRRNLFCLCSPSEKLVAKLEQFWDTTLWKSPNRVERLLQLQEAGTFASTPSRQIVLDRQVQYLDISPDAQDVVRKCRRIASTAKCLGVAMAAAATGWASFSSTGRTALFFGRRVSVWLLLSGALFWGAAAWVAEKVQREYYFIYTDDMRRQDLKTIPKQIWMDK